MQVRLKAVSFLLSAVLLGATIGPAAAQLVGPSNHDIPVPPRRAAPPRQAPAKPAPAAPVPRMADSTDYDSCIRLVGSDANAALETAGSWIVRGGGFAARDCQALALIRLGSPGEAAQRLDALAEEMGRSGAPDLPTVLAQSGQAWLAAGRPERAYALQTAALKLTPADVDLLIDRAVTLASRKNYREALADLSRAVQLAPTRIDALVYRGTAHRFLGELPQARADIDRALQLDPRAADALLERGNLKRLAGDTAGARADWLALLRSTAENSPQADAARTNIERLDYRSR